MARVESWGPEFLDFEVGIGEHALADEDADA